MSSNIANFVETKRVTRLVTQSETPVKTGCRTGLKEIVSLGLPMTSYRTSLIAVATRDTRKGGLSTGCLREQKL